MVAGGARGRREELMPPELAAALADMTVLQVLGWLAAVGVVVAFAVKAWPWLKGFVRLVEALSDLPEFMERIRHQVENDHDTNLRDEVTQILDSVDDLSGQMAQIVDWKQLHEKKSDATILRIQALELKETP